MKIKQNRVASSPDLLSPVVDNFNIIPDFRIIFQIATCTFFWWFFSQPQTRLYILLKIIGVSSSYWSIAKLSLWIQFFNINFLLFFSSFQSLLNQLEHCHRMYLSRKPLKFLGKNVGCFWMNLIADQDDNNCFCSTKGRLVFSVSCQKKTNSWLSLKEINHTSPRIWDPYKLLKQGTASAFWQLFQNSNTFGNLSLVASSKNHSNQTEYINHNLTMKFD